MSLGKVIDKVDYSAYGGRLAVLWAAILRRMAGNRLSVTGVGAFRVGRDCRACRDFGQQGQRNTKEGMGFNHEIHEHTKVFSWPEAVVL